MADGDGGELEATIRITVDDSGIEAGADEAVAKVQKRTRSKPAKVRVEFEAPNDGAPIKGAPKTHKVKTEFVSDGKKIKGAPEKIEIKAGVTLDRTQAEALLAPTRASFATAFQRGRQQFHDLGCAGCHQPILVLHNPVLTVAGLPEGSPGPGFQGPS